MSQRVPFQGLFLNIVLCTVATLVFVGCGSPDVDPTGQANNDEQTNAVDPPENGDPGSTPGEQPEYIPGMPPELGGPPNPQPDLSGDLTKKSPTELLAITEHLEAQLEGLASRVRSNPISQEEMDGEHKSLLSQLLSASSTVFDSKDSNDEQRIDATRVKAETMARLIQFDEKYNDMLKTFAEVAATDANERVAAIGGVYSFLFSIHDVMRETDPLPTSHLEATFKRIVENKEIGISEFAAVDSALNNLSRSQIRDTVVPLREQLAEKFATSENQEVAAAATQLTASLAHQALMHGLEQHIFSIYQDKADETTQAALAEATANIVKTSPTGPVFGELSNHSMNLEYSGHPEAAKAINSALEAGFADHESEEVKANAQVFLDEAKKRIGAVGAKFELEGIQLDGSEFNWDSYRGKVVLVDFWASYCRPCIEEMPNVIENYEKYREKGFEVVGINVDPQISQATAFLERKKLPWPTIISKDAETNDLGSNVNALRYGVIAIPFVVLVDRDGTVIDIHLRGENLGAKLAEIFGDAAPAETETPANPPATETPATEGETPTPKETEPAPKAETPIEKSPTEEAPAPKAEEAPPIDLNPPKSATPEGNSHLQIQETTHFVSTLLDDDNNSDDNNSDDNNSDDNNNNDNNNNDDGKKDDDDAAEDDEDVLKLSENPYLPRKDLTDLELLDFLLSMADKPKSIKHRPGYTDAVVVAADRMMKRDTKEKYQVIAAMEKFRVLHWDASFGKEKADKQLMEFVTAMKDDTREKIKKEVQFFQLERRVINVDEAKIEEVPELLNELKTYFTDTKLSDKHLRIASSTVHAINRLEDSEKREEHFKEFGGIFSESRDRELARYGKKLAKVKPAAASDLVGKPLELEGETVDGADFVWDAYRGKVVLVDFWATWCGPCRKEMPHVKQLYNELKDKNFEVVGVSLDQDMESLITYINENQIEWANIAGDKAQEAAQKYGVRGIPTMMVIDAEGNIAGVSHNVGQLKAKIKELLEKK